MYFFLFLLLRFDLFLSSRMVRFLFDSFLCNLGAPVVLLRLTTAGHTRYRRFDFVCNVVFVFVIDIDIVGECSIVPLKTLPSTIRDQ